MNDLDALLAEVEDTVGDNNVYNKDTRPPSPQQYKSSSSYEHDNYSSSSSSRSGSSSYSSKKDNYASDSNNNYASDNNNHHSNSNNRAARSVDPLDDLLSLTEETVDSTPAYRYNGSSSSTTTTASTARPSYRSSAYPTNSMRKDTSNGSSNGSSNGAQVLLGGSSCKLGANASKFSSIATDRLLCLKCMCEVVRFADYHWDDDVDYMFFRNYWPEPERLSPKLKPRKGYAAYCCQCCWTSVREIAAVGSACGCGRVH